MVTLVIIIAKVSACAVFWLQAVADAVKNGNYCIPQEQRAVVPDPSSPCEWSGPQTTPAYGKIHRFVHKFAGTLETAFIVSQLLPETAGRFPV